MAGPVETGSVSRRTVLKGLAGAAGLVAVPTILAACGTSGSSTAPESAAASAAAPSAAASAAPSAAESAAASAALGGSVHIGSYHTDPGEPEGQKAVDAAFTADTGIQVVENIVDHSTFQNQISNYLGGQPDTAYSWFSGFRMKFFADKGFNVPIDDLWATIKDNFSEGFQNAVVGNDGKVYGVPVDYYPWAVFYRKSLFADKNYAIPTTWDELKALATKMQADGITPIAFADQEGWPAMGTFDILNLRMNGYDFHVGLMAGEQKWTDPKVTAVFQKWAEVVPFQSKNYASAKWTDAATELLNKKSGMFLLGLFMSSVFQNSSNKDDINDLDFFPFPALGTEFDAEQALDAPIDTWQIAAKSPNLDKELDQAKAYLESWSTGKTQSIFFQHQPGVLPTAKDADTSTYTPLQKKAVEVVGNAKRITQFLDRDTRADFAGPQGMQGFLQQFLANPTGDVAKLQQAIQDFWDQLPPLT